MPFTYEKIVFWKKKKFITPSGEAEKLFIDDISKPMTEWLHDSPLNDIVFNPNLWGRERLITLPPPMLIFP